MLVGTLKALFTLDSSGFQAGMKEIKTSLDNSKAKIEETSRSMRSFRVVSAASFAAMGTAAVVAYKRINRFAIEMEGLNRRIEFATGSSEKAARAYAFVTKESNRLGISLEAAARQYGSLAAAAKGTAMEGEGIERLFTSIAEISAIMSLNIYDTQLVFLAFQQMMSKGKIVAEEVRRQLAERLPGAFAMMARSIGVTTAELDKLMATGQLAATDVLPAFSSQISMELGPAVDGLNDSLSVTVNRMRNAWFEMKKGIAESKLLTNTLKGLAGVMEGIAKLVTEPESMGGLLFGPQGMTQELERLSEVINTRYTEGAEEATAATDSLNTSFVNLSKTGAQKLQPMLQILQKATDFVIDWAVGAKQSFKDLINSMIKDMLRLVAQAHIIAPIMSSFQGLSFSGFGGSSVGQPTIGAGMSSAGSISSSSGSSNNVNINISAVDSKSVTELLRDNPQAVTSPLIDALQSGDRGLQSSLSGNLF